MEPAVLLETSRAVLREPVCPAGVSTPAWGLQEHREGLGVSIPQKQGRDRPSHHTCCAGGL